MRTKACVVLIVLALIASSCASMSKRQKCIAASAAAGAVIGGGAGTIIGNQGDIDNRAEGSAIGTGAGAIIGGLMGLLLCKEEVPVVEAEEPPPEPEEVTPPAPEEPKVVEKVVLNGINFDFDSAVVKEEFFPVIDEAASIIQEHPEKKVIVEGYTCSLGEEDYNAALSLQRATSVKEYLVGKGVSADRLMVKGYGEEDPVADNTTLEGRKKNRRVEFEVIDDEYLSSLYMYLHYCLAINFLCIPKPFPLCYLCS